MSARVRARERKEGEKEKEGKRVYARTSNINFPYSRPPANYSRCREAEGIEAVPYELIFHPDDPRIVRYRDSGRPRRSQSNSAAPTRGIAINGRCPMLMSARVHAHGEAPRKGNEKDVRQKDRGLAA